MTQNANMKLPNKILYHNDFQSINETLNFLNDNLLSNHNFKIFNAETIEINFSKCQKIESYHISPLACIIYEYQKAGFNIKLTGITTTLNKYFLESGFLNFCNNYDQDTIFPAPINPNIFPLWRINQEASNIYPIEVGRFFENNQLRGKDLQPINTALGEMMNNVFDHSGCEIPGYVFTQFHPKKKIIYICVCDLGCTIPVSVNKYLKENQHNEIEDIDALLECIKLNFSTYSKPHNRGRGLDNILSIVNSNSGKFTLASGKAAIQKSANSDFNLFKLTDPFPGTIVVIGLNTSNLEVKEMEISDEIQIF